MVAAGKAYLLVLVYSFMETQLAGKEIGEVKTAFDEFVQLPVEVFSRG
ncbi:MAG TPA: hypothetical protein VJ695_05875 [Nitrososphaera sp.]|nr:hypothetical protein [Nitrososphaera sp.]